MNRRISDEEWNRTAERVAGLLLVLVVLAAVVVAVLFAFRPDLVPPMVADWIDRAHIAQGTVRLAVVVAGVVLVAVLVVVARHRRMIGRRERFAAGKVRGRADRFAAGLVPELPKGYDPARDCRATRWRKGRPQRVKLRRLPPEFDHSDAAKAKLTTTISERMGTKARGTWRRGGRVTFGPLHTDPGDLAKERGRDRVAGLAAELFGGPCRVSDITKWGGPDGYLPVAFALAYPFTTKDDNPAFRRRVEDVLGRKLGVRLKGSWDALGDRVKLLAVPEMPKRVVHPGSEFIAKTDRLFLPLGVDVDGNVVGWDAGKYAHALANGPTGSGKTSAVRSAIAAALIKGWEVYLADPKRIEFGGYRLGPRGGWGVKSIASKDEDISDMLIRLKALMDARYDEGDELQKRGERPRWDEYTPILVVLDEFTELVLALGDLQKARQLRGTPEAVQAIGTLARMARVCGIHLIILMQRPDAETFPSGGARDQFTYRFSLNALSEQSARMMWGESDWGRFLPSIKGRGLAAVYGEEPQEVQFYWTPDPAFPEPKDEALRDDLRHAAENVQDHVPASMEGRPYDLGPLVPSSEAVEDELTPDGELAEATLADGQTVETVTVLAETLTQGDRILRDGEIYEVRKINDPDDADLVKVMIRPRQSRRTQTITCKISDKLARVDERMTDPHRGCVYGATEGLGTEASTTTAVQPPSDHPTGGQVPTGTGGPDDVLTVPPEWEREYAADLIDTPPLPGQELPSSSDDGDLFRPPDDDLYEPPADTENTRSHQPGEPVQLGRAEPYASDAGQSFAAMFRQAWEAMSGDDPASKLGRESLMKSAPDTPEMRKLIAELGRAEHGPGRTDHDKISGETAAGLWVKPKDSSASPWLPATEHDTEPTKSTEQAAIGQTADERPSTEPTEGKRRAGDLMPGDRVRMRNRKGQHPAYQVTRVEPRAGDQVELSLKPQRGKGRVETVPAGDLLELAPNDE